MVQYWAILTEAEMRTRNHINSGGMPQFANFELKFIPSCNHDGINVVAEWEDPTDDRWLEAIKIGVDRFVSRRKESGRPVCKTTLIMKKVISHPIDTTEQFVSYRIDSILYEIFNQHESPVDGPDMAPDKVNDSV